MLSIVVRSFEKNIFIYSHSVNKILTDLMILCVSAMLKNYCHETKKDDILSIKSIFVRVKK